MVIRIDIRLEKCVSRFCLYVTQVVLLNFNRKSEILSALRTSTPRILISANYVCQE